MHLQLIKSKTAFAQEESDKINSHLHRWVKGKAEWKVIDKKTATTKKLTTHTQTAHERPEQVYDTHKNSPHPSLSIFSGNSYPLQRPGTIFEQLSVNAIEVSPKLCLLTLTLLLR